MPKVKTNPFRGCKRVPGLDFNVSRLDMLDGGKALAVVVRIRAWRRARYGQEVVRLNHSKPID